jgi:Ni,Fe-hydrogenase III component G
MTDAEGIDDVAAVLPAEGGLREIQSALGLKKEGLPENSEVEGAIASLSV